MARQQSGLGKSLVVGHRITKWEYYEVKKEELDIIEKGTQNNVCFDFGIAAGSTAVSFFIAWLATDYSNNEKLYYAYLIVWIAFLIAFVILMVLAYQYYKERKNAKDVFNEIRDRQPEEDSQESTE